MKASKIELMRFSIESSASLLREARPFGVFANILLANKSKGFASLIPMRHRSSFGRVDEDLCLKLAPSCLKPVAHRLCSGDGGAVIVASNPSTGLRREGSRFPVSHKGSGRKHIHKITSKLSAGQIGWKSPSTHYPILYLKDHTTC